MSLNIFNKKYNRVIILGSSGFVGSSLIKSLKISKINHIGYSSKDINLLNIKDLILLKKNLKPDDTIVFISAIAPCTSKEMYNSNISMLKNFSSILFRNIVKHIIYISSDAVYSDNNNFIRENDKKYPDNFHGKMHVERENIFSEICKINSISLSIIRPTLIYGSEDTHNGYGPNQFIRSILAGNEISLFGKGEERRDHIYIDDVIQIIQKCLVNETIGSFTAATGKVISFFDIAKIIYKYKNLSIENIIYKDRNGPMPHNGYRAFDISKLYKDFSNIDITPIDTGIIKMIKLLQ